MLTFNLKQELKAAYSFWFLKTTVKPSKSLTFLNLILVASLLSTACTPSSNQLSLEPENANSRSLTEENIAEGITLKIAMIPDRNYDKQPERQDIFTQYLEERLGVPVEIEVASDYETAVDLLVEGKVSMAYLGPLSYIKAKERNPNLEPIVAHIEKTTGRPWYTSVIIANVGGGIKSIEDLKGRTIGFVSESSTSGYLFPSAHFKEVGLNPEKDFASIRYAGGHDKNLDALISGEVDAIAVDKAAYQKAKEVGKLPEETYQVIWESNPIPNSPIVINNQLPQNFKLELKKALINAPGGMIAVGGNESNGYTLVQDEDYEPIRQVKRKLAE